ncbi:SRPBCC family protein [Nocardioides kribbensis]|uniref:SRPBCC family protein n=1 Tax=Nocardioides kribbensis TaxID=305517 RepID=A0ABV1NYF5_9ACTN
MSHTSRDLAATPETVWEVLSDGWMYPLFVVGASRMREVDDDWPEVGARLHHSVGAWPALLDDSTQVVEMHPRTTLTLLAYGRPFGRARVTFRLTPSGAGTSVEVEERVDRGPGRFVPSLLHDPPMTWRNTETLRRLAYVCENRP